MNDFQISLIPEEAVKGQQEEVALSLLPLSFPGRRVTAAMKGSIARFGVIQPVLLIKASEGDNRGVKPDERRVYWVADGRSRILNARAAGLESIPALVFSAGYSPSQVLALVANTMRSDNEVTDLLAIEELIGQGATIDQIAEATGLGKATLDKRLKLLGLIPELRAGFEAGKMASSTAEKAAGLPVAEQRELARLLAKNGRLKGKDVAAIRTTVYQASALTLPDELFGTPSLPLGAPPEARQDAAEQTQGNAFGEQLAERGADAMALLWRVVRRWRDQGALSQETDSELWAEIETHYGDEFKRESEEIRERAAKRKSRKSRSKKAGGA